MDQDRFVIFLKEELERKKRLNHRYSLRSYAKLLGVYHGTLSGILSGKRRLTEKAKSQLAKKIDPDNIQGFVMIPEAKRVAHVILDQKTFNEISEWHFDAIIELVKLKTMPWSVRRASQYLGLSESLVEKSTQKLIDIGLLKETPQGLKVQGEYTTNIEFNEQTSDLMRKYQKSVLELSSRALETVDRKWRDHQSTTLAISKKDVPKVKEIVRNFSFELSSLLQNENSEFDEVYQLAISFFPLNQMDDDLKVSK